MMHTPKYFHIHSNFCQHFDPTAHTHTPPNPSKDVCMYMHVENIHISQYQHHVLTVVNTVVLYNSRREHTAKFYCIYTNTVYKV